MALIEATPYRVVELVVLFHNELDPMLEKSSLSGRLTVDENRKFRDPVAISESLYSLKIGSSLHYAEAMDSHLNALLVNADRDLDVLLYEGLMPSRVVLRIVQYMSVNDSDGPGFFLEPRWIDKLSKFKGSIDIDQYVRD